MFHHSLRGIPHSIIDSFRGRNLFWHALAIGLTCILVVSGFDWWYFRPTRSDTLRPLIMIAGLGGFLVPLVLPAIFWCVGAIRRDTHAVRVGWAVAQAAIAGWLISAAYKALTGRIQPNGSDGVADISHNFQFGFLEHGVFWGWPSSHATVAFATAVTLFLFYRPHGLRWVAIFWALIVAFGASIGFHWFSDALAGAIIGTVVGTVVVHRFNT